MDTTTAPTAPPATIANPARTVLRRLPAGSVAAPIPRPAAGAVPTAGPAAGAVPTPRPVADPPRRPARWRRLSAGLAAGALLAVAPLATAATVTAAAPAPSPVLVSAVDGPSSTAPSSTVLTTRRTGSVLL
ncbi:hypothetical protein [Nakamurella endophytica]|uniref:Uncharacterized protein n=1 Tax=Nakamurella endophytica TaxID=1748367 RepID=A0A917SXP5_9ACTN|nr:hypothetical protein [Nakamurella endophytica]GGM03034.1 hypothetical protein GCM10011594_23960 [Nakamurella endophytica]